MEVSLSELYRLEERDNSSDNSGENSPSSTTFSTILSSPKRSRRAIQKKVVTVPMKDVVGSRFKGDCTPPSDSWSWRKYGQKPIKGSPYPRGYYRCSSSKGCPARRQVERSRSDPSMLVVTYSYEHNHPWPTSRNHHQNRHATTTTTRYTTLTTPTPDPTNAATTTAAATITTVTPVAPSTHSKIESQEAAVSNETQIEPPSVTDELWWFTSDHQHNNHVNHQFPDINRSSYSSCTLTDLDMTKIFSMGEEDESLFADLGELPECSLVFPQAAVAAGGKEQRLWFGTMG